MINPAVSVIIPMYNVENYIARCLESILSQTFQDYEVIIVDDCSSDNSYAVAESYVEKFGGRMTLIKAKKNSGGAGYVPRNTGLKHSRGEYIFFVDADDFIVETALEILHTAAMQYNADVVYTSRYYFHGKDGKIQEIVDKDSFGNDKMTLTVDDREKLCEQLFTQNGIYQMPWSKFVQRKFLLENKIEFPKIISGGDFLWTIQVICNSKRFLRLPIALYFHNENADSATRKEYIPKKKIVDTFKAFIMGAKALQDLSSRIAVLKRNKKCMHFATGVFFANCLARNFEARKHFSTVELYEILCDEFANDLVVPFLLSVIDSEQNALFDLQKRVAELENKE